MTNGERRRIDGFIGVYSDNRKPQIFSFWTFQYFRDSTARIERGSLMATPKDNPNDPETQEPTPSREIATKIAKRPDLTGLKGTVTLKIITHLDRFD